MFHNYLKIALRNLSKYKGFTFIQISGLSIGIGVALIIAMLVIHDFGYDTFHKDGNRIFRIVSSNNHGGNWFPNSGVPAPMAEAIKNNISGIEEMTAFHLWPNIKTTVYKNESQKVLFDSKNVIFAAPDYFKLFSYEWIAGSYESALNEPFKVVLTEKRAKEYFSIDDAREALGKDIIYQDSIHTQVSGVVKDLENLTEFNFKEFISFATIEKTFLKNEFHMEAWGNTNSSSQLFLKLHEGTNPESIVSQFPAFLLRNWGADEVEKKRHELQNIRDIHYNEKYGNFLSRKAHKPTLYGLVLLSIFLLIMACINFINLTTAQSAVREKEISVRKTFGSSRKQLIYQFLSESIFKVLLASFFSLLLIPLLFDYFSDFLPEELNYNDYINFQTLLLLILFIIIIGFLAGIYPAFVMAAFKPGWLLKTKLTVKAPKQLLRKGLIIFQFVIAFCLIMGSYLVSKQIKYGLNKDLGYETEGLINIRVPDKNINRQKEQLLQKLKSISELENIALGGEPPASRSSTSISVEKEQDSDQYLHIEFKYGDHEYVNVYDLKIIAGRNILPSDSLQEIVVNETLAKQLGVDNPMELIGETLKFGGNATSIVGVVNDFHAKSIHQKVAPLLIFNESQNYNTFHIKLSPNTENWEAALKKTEAAWQKVFPEETFDYQFFDEKIASFYDREVKLNKLLSWATGIAIFISCLGLIGIVSFTIQQKTKEIGIRKVLGASIDGILMLLSKGFIKLIIIAFVIATPIGYYFINDWLQGFEYKISITWWLFAVPGCAMLVLAIIILSIQSAKAALANPVDSLRNE